MTSTSARLAGSRWVLGQRASYAVVGYGLGVTLLGAGLPSPLYGLYQHQFGFSTGTLTLAFALYSFTLLPALLICGPWSDRAGRQPVLLTGLALTVLAMVVFLFARGLGWILAARAVQGLGVAAVLTAGTALATETHPRGDRARAALLATTATPAGLAAGCSMAGLLAQYAPWPTRTCFIVELVLLIPALSTVWALPDPAGHADTRQVATHGRGADEQRAEQPRRSVIQRPRIPAAMRRRFLLVSVAVFAAWAVGGVFLSVAPSYAAQLAGTHNLALLGAVPAVMFTAAVIGEITTGVLAPQPALVTGCALLIAGLAAVAASFPAASLLVLFGGALLSGTGLGLTFLAALTVINHLAPVEQRGEVTAAFYVWLFAGNAVPVLALGLLTGVVTLSSAVLGFALIIGAVAALTAALTAATTGLDTTTATR